VVLPQFQFDALDTPQHFVDLPEKVLVFDPRHVDLAARQAAFSNSPIDMVFPATHASI